ncbi:MAG: SDR family oxidoreductase [Salinisphaera sp.]|nr:SDR family oxidoreductase [Salinisphaera sp.]
MRRYWDLCCTSHLQTTRNQRGSILFTGATASLRGAANFAAFASAKHVLRALAQSMARELGPKNIHIAHIAENYWQLHVQPRDAWTFELDLRPYMETW